MKEKERTIILNAMEGYQEKGLKSALKQVRSEREYIERNYKECFVDCIFKASERFLVEVKTAKQMLEFADKIYPILEKKKGVKNA